jgi:DNA repair protein RadC
VHADMRLQLSLNIPYDVLNVRNVGFLDLRLETKEHFIVLHLDGKNRIVCFDRVSIVSLNQAIVHSREVFKTTCLLIAAAVLLRA